VAEELSFAACVREDRVLARAAACAVDIARIFLCRAGPDRYRDEENKHAFSCRGQELLAQGALSRSHTAWTSLRLPRERARSCAKAAVLRKSFVEALPVVRVFHTLSDDSIRISTQILINKNISECLKGG
jgi:hypothetical protein